jgi:dTDP-4-dehydrorhamnose reductase
VRVFVTGRDGLLGRSLVPRLGRRHDVDGVGRADGDIADGASLGARLDRFRPQALLHLAAWTAVDRCQAEPEEAFRVNETGTRVVAEAAGSRGLPVLALSTDYVFDGAKSSPYTEEDRPRPLSVYGRSKLAGEEALRRACPAWTIVRTAWLYGPGGPNFVETILRLLAERETVAVVDDQRGCPTYAEDLAAGLEALLERGARGLYHMAGGGVATWCDLARATARLAGIDAARVRPATTAEVPRPAPRPVYSVLDCAKAARDHGVALRPWGDALADYMSRRGGGKDGRSRDA